MNLNKKKLKKKMSKFFGQSSSSESESDSDVSIVEQKRPVAQR